jgi:sugar phosphate isomerase/epimerase
MFVKRFVWGCVMGVLLSAGASAADGPSTGSGSAKGGGFPFFAFCMDTHDSEKRDVTEQAALLKELGYDGLGHLWLDGLEERVKSLEGTGLRLFQLCLRVNLSKDKAPYDPRLKELIPLLKGQRSQLTLIMSGLPPSDESGDARAVEIVREIADLAQAQEAQVILYPHTNDWMERVEDGVRVAKKVNRPNVGTMFNLCHWLKVDGKSDLRVLLGDAMPHLFAVSVHGADKAEAVQSGDGNWIQALGQGSYDVGAFLKLLEELKYTGPVGLQCYGIQGDARTHLTQSIAAWKRYNK